MVAHTIFEMHLIDVVTTYLYGSLHANIYMNVSLGHEIISQLGSIPSKHYCVKLQKTLNGLKQSRCIWYQ